MLRRVTQPPHIAGPLCLSLKQTCNNYQSITPDST
jgi:hypothetical protein